MTIEDTVARLLLPIAYGLAVAVAAALLAHVARRYGPAPKRVPTGFGFDGRPRGNAPKQILWIAPVLIAGAVAFLGIILFVRQPAPADEQRPLLAVIMLSMAEVAGLLIWTTDRQIEVAQKQTFRIAPARLLRTFLPLLATLAVAIGLSVQLAR